MTDQQLIDAALEEVLAILAVEDIENDPDDLYSGRSHRMNKIRALKGKPLSQVPVKATSGTEGEIVAIADEVATQHPFDTPPAAAPVGATPNGAKVDWQPIETAPYHNEPLIVLTKEGNICEANNYAGLWNMPMAYQDDTPTHWIARPEQRNGE